MTEAVLDTKEVRRWKRYPNYCDVEIGWIIQSPDHWNTIPLKYLVDLRSGDGITGESITDVGSFPVYGGNGFRGFTEEFTHDGHYVLIGRQGAHCGNVNYATGRFWASEHAVVATPKRELDTIWLGEMMRAMNLNQYSVTAAQPGLSMEFVGNLRTVVPPLQEQRAIAAFLDRETARIDALIGHKERLIALLEEKRQAVISHAVTRGLDPNAKMKDSGVEWLGVIPAHWNAKRLKFLTHQIVDGTHFTPTYVDEGIPFIRVTDISSGPIDWANVKRIPQHEHEELTKRCRPEYGDLLLSKNGTVGIPLVVNTHQEFSIFVSLCLLKLTPVLLSEFAKYVFLSKQIEEQIHAGGKLNTITNLHMDKIKQFYFSVPPIDEQVQIVAWLDDRITRLEGLMSKVREGIERLQEYRTALISAAVTGQIDVREEGSST